MHAIASSIIHLADAFPIPLLFLFAMIGGGILVLILEKILERGYSELFYSPITPKFARIRCEPGQNAQPIDAEPVEVRRGISHVRESRSTRNTRPPRSKG